jgi:lipopolysaccharide/colanic/teichoic acid biosynthesis glycosyltransferase
VAKLPTELKERYNEEWENALQEIPGDIAKLIYSVGLLRAASTIRNDSLRATQVSSTRAALSIRVFEVMFSAMMLVLFLPHFLMIAIAIKIESPGPVFYSSKRIGKNGVIFRRMKFRTMRVDFDQQRSQFIAECGPDMLLGMRHDARITRLGRYLRRFSFDELPLFLNVLKGDMSLVGPTPLTPDEVNMSDSYHLRSLGIRPGIADLRSVQEDESYSPKQPNLRSYIKVLLRIWWRVFVAPIKKPRARK